VWLEYSFYRFLTKAEFREVFIPFQVYQLW